MATINVTANPFSLATLKSKFQDYYILTKPEVNLLILMTTSAGYYLGSRGPFRFAGLAKHAGRHLAGCQRHGDPESMVGAWLGRPDAAHRVSSVALGKTQRPRSVLVRHAAEHCRRAISCALW